MKTTPMVKVSREITAAEFKRFLREQGLRFDRELRSAMLDIFNAAVRHGVTWEEVGDTMHRLSAESIDGTIQASALIDALAEAAYPIKAH